MNDVKKKSNNDNNKNSVKSNYSIFSSVESLLYYIGIVIYVQ